MEVEEKIYVDQSIEKKNFKHSKFVRCIKTVVNPPRDMAPSEKKYLQESIDEYADFREENPLIDAIINDLLVGSTPTLSGELYDEYRHPLNQEKLMFIINGKSSRNKVSLTRELRKFRKDQIQETENQAAITIQKVARGYQQRQHLKKNQAAIAVQKVARGYQQRQHLKKNQAAIAVQKVARGYQQRQHLKKNQAAIAVQKVARGYQQRQHLKRIRRPLLFKR